MHSAAANYNTFFNTFLGFNRVQFAKPDNNTADANFGYSLLQVGEDDSTTGARQIQRRANFTF